MAADLSGYPPRRRRVPLGLAALAAAGALWAGLGLPWLFRVPAGEFRLESGLSPRARELAARHLRLWTDPELRRAEIGKMRRSNAEWDFMGRSFLVWALGEIALRRPERAGELLPVMDRIIDETLRLEAEHGQAYFLMGYARLADFRQQPPRSLFVDGEIALMLGYRRLVAERADYAAELARRVAAMAERLEASPSHCAESYQDECWLFCNSVALAAIRVADHLDGADHRDLRRRWLAAARRRLLHRESGLLVSAFPLAIERPGDASDGPEGSSIWLAAHCLRLVDEPFAREQYARARAELGRTCRGFGWAREWPRSWRGPLDVDSGVVVPLLDAGPASSGLAFVAAASFDDREYLAALASSLEFGALPCRSNGELHYAASNQVGDAVLLYATVLGPAWDRVLAAGGNADD